ncbi:MAG: DHH family phosphoesterase [Desulfurella sp.]|uniref:Phosphoesterase RecJ domain-containing protein n=2 Tax=Desulfurella TaxID=33001 RepID=A0A1G6LQW3_9BACT|nr:bifunctional oligoribonuclease/PAP phosphatase NrnA [Desulfurella multipotens]SDC45581.1 phosphoesterase RecJ domain-containing protein [Desulfurella multipotens]
MSEHILEKIGYYLKNYNDFLIVGHKDPDGDAIGSSLALYKALTEYGKNTIVANTSKISDLYFFLDDVKNILQLQNNEKAQVIITVDSADFERTKLDKNYVKDKILINIDHHPTNTQYGNINYVVPQAAAVGCLIYEILKFNNIPISLKTAEYLYLSILTDTGSFRYSSTSANAFRIASDLIDLGVKPWKIAYNIYESKKLSTLKLMGQAINTITPYYNNKLIIMHITQKMYNETNTTSDDTEGFVNIARSVKGCEVGVLLREDRPNFIKVSLRSKDEVDVSNIAASFGGGGHKNAAGFELEGSIEGIKEKLIKAFSFLS